MMLLPAELVIDSAYGSFFHNGVGRAVLVTTNLYWSFSAAAATSPDQEPLPSEVSGDACVFQLLKAPATFTPLANGAQTRNATPPAKGVAPIPGCCDAGIYVLRQVA